MPLYITFGKRRGTKLENRMVFIHLSPQVFAENNDTSV